MPTDSGRSIPVWAWVSGGAGIALAGVTVGFVVDYVSAVSTLKSKCGDDLNACGAFDPTGENARKNRDQALFLGFGAGALLGLGAGVIGIALASTSKRSPPKSSVSRVSVEAAPYLGRGFGGIRIGAQF